MHSNYYGAIIRENNGDGCNKIQKKESYLHSQKSHLNSKNKNAK